MGKANDNPTKLLAYDTFLQSEGALTGKTLPIGGTWAGAGDADDFTVHGTEDRVRRSAVSDSNTLAGRFAIAGSSEPVNAKVTVDVAGEDMILTSGDLRRGVVLRYTNTENFLLASYWGGIAYNWANIELRGVIAGVSTQLAIKTVIDPYFETRFRRMSLQVTDTGNWKVWFYDSEATSVPAPVIEGQWSQLATGGSLAKGKGGFYDAQKSAVANTRYYDNFTLHEAEPTPVMLYSGKAAEIRSDGYLRQDSTGTYYGEFPGRGGDLYLEPEGDSGAINRLVIVARRNDVEAEADSNVTDKISCEVYVRERFLAPR